MYSVPPLLSLLASSTILVPSRQAGPDRLPLPLQRLHLQFLGGRGDGRWWHQSAVPPYNHTQPNSSKDCRGGGLTALVSDAVVPGRIAQFHPLCRHLPLPFPTRQPQALPRPPPAATGPYSSCAARRTLPATTLGVLPGGSAVPFGVEAAVEAVVVVESAAEAAGQ